MDGAGSATELDLHAKQVAFRIQEGCTAADTPLRRCRAASVAELQAEGGPLLVAAARGGGLASRHPFLHAAVGDLRVVRQVHNQTGPLSILSNDL
jgi:hypothetical protein